MFHENISSIFRSISSIFFQFFQTFQLFHVIQRLIKHCLLTLFQKKVFVFENALFLIVSNELTRSQFLKQFWFSIFFFKFYHNSINIEKINFEHYKFAFFINSNIFRIFFKQKKTIFFLIANATKINYHDNKISLRHTKIKIHTTQ